jgi:predicted GNAT superfamily acetyltransferase
MNRPDSSYVRYEYRDLITESDFEAALALQRAVWRFPPGTEPVSVDLLRPAVLHGGIALGAFSAANELVGMCVSTPSECNHVHQSLLLAVVRPHRGRGVGQGLKAEQLRRARAMGVESIQWTYDPLLSVNAHLNVRVFGAVVVDYRQALYDSTSPLHKGIPTDRFLVECPVRKADGPRPAGFSLGDGCAHAINSITEEDGYPVSSAVDASLRAPALTLAIPSAFDDLSLRQPDLALSWRLLTRHAFTHYLGLGYRVVDFSGDARGGRYLLVAGASPTSRAVHGVTTHS